MPPRPPDVVDQESKVSSVTVAGSASAAARAAVAIVECPRCGHDLRGVVESWRDACPLTGCCAECGVEFEWRHVAGLDRMPRWFVECERRRWFSGTRTLVRSLAPWLFWRRIRMTMPVRWPLWTHPLRLAVILLLLAMVATAVRAWMTTNASIARDPNAVAISVAAAVVLPALSVPIDEVVDRWRPGWSAAGPGFPPNGMFVSNWTGVGLRTQAAPPSHCALGVWRGLRPVATITLEALVLSVATFAVLPVVRRRAKVKWLHIFRAAIYGLALVPVMAVACWSLDLEWMNRIGLIGTMTSPFSASAYRSVPWEIVLLPALLFGWWWCVSARHLRLQRPRAVATSVAAVGSIAALALHYLLMPNEVIGWLRNAPLM